MAQRGVVSIGVAASVGADLVEALAPVIEAAGFHALWVNDTPGADALPVLDAAARATSRLTLATGVVPVDRHPPAQIVAGLERHRMPQDRLTLGIGAGGVKKGGLRLVGDAVDDLLAATSARIVVGALGPRMRRLAVDQANGVLLTWLTPAAAHEQADEARAAASDPHIALYVRTALSEAAHRRLHIEKHKYASIPAYAENFARQRAHVDDTVLDVGTSTVEQRLDDYRSAVDEVVLRAITPADSIDDYLRFIDDARALV